jgi:hypothetical protein
MIIILNPLKQEFFVSIYKYLTENTRRRHYEDQLADTVYENIWYFFSRWLFETQKYIPFNNIKTGRARSNHCAL